MAHDVFVSFSFQNQRETEDIVNRLSNQYAISCWICTRDVTGGSRYQALIPDAIDEAKAVVLVQSNAANTSKDIKQEISIAFDEDKFIIPFKIDDSEPKGVLRYVLHGVDYIDGTIPEFEDRIRDLARAIQAVLAETPEELSGQAPAEPAGVTLRSSQIAYSDIFYGRQDLIREIHSVFDSGVKTIFLKGMAGIGKTELAKQYVKTYRGAYDTIVFARFDQDLLSLIIDDEQFAITGVNRKIKQDGTVQTDEEYADEKLKLLAKIADKKTIIIVDNYDVMFDPWLDRLTSAGECRLLFTTRCDQDTKKYRVLPVRELSDKDLKAFMIDCCQREYTELEEDDPGFETLFAMTGRHTLTLELLAKYICENAVESVSDLVQMLSASGFALPGDSRIVYGSRTETVSKIIRDLFRLTSLTPEEKRFMHYLALMPAAGVHQQYFKKWCGPLYAQARLRLLKLSRVKYDAQEKKVSLHPIIRQIIRENFELSYDECRPFIDAVVADLEENVAWNYPMAKKEDLARCCISIMEQFSSLNEDNFDAWYQMAVFLNFIDDYHRCCQRLENMRAFAAAHYGEDSMQTAQMLFRLGWVSLNRVQLRDARRYQEEALKKFGPYQKAAASDYVHCLCDYSNSPYMEYRETGDTALLDASMDNVLKAYEAAEIAVRENLCKDAKVRKGLAANTLIKHYILHGDYARAEEKIQEAKTLYGSGPDCYLDLASITAKLGMVQIELGDPQAVQSLQQAISLYEQYGGRYSGTHFECLLALSGCFEKANDLPAAIAQAKKALDYARVVYEEGHSRIVKIKKKLSELEAALCAS